MRSLNTFEEKNLKILVELNIDYALIQTTLTGLKKGIIDATFPVRKFLKEKGYHNYDIQNTGANENGVVTEMILFYELNKFLETRCSMYRPKSKGKGGDPRIWFYGLHKFIQPDNILSLHIYENKLYVINISRINLEEKILRDNSFLSDLLLNISEKSMIIVNELLGKLKQISKLGFVKSLVSADTGVGRTLETLLGLKMNSSKSPDYKGIELKSFREKKNTRKDLFAKVPNWKLSKFKSRNEILDEFGYWDKGVFRLYNTIRGNGRNAQGLILEIRPEKDWLVENSDKTKIGDFLVWELEVLRKELQEKHKETFWITTESKVVDNMEYFWYKLVEHTRNPRVDQFETLIETGAITVDYPIKRLPNGRVEDKGCKFKLKRNCLGLLFPPSDIYDLLQ